MKKEDYLNLLRNNPIFQSALSKASSDEERRAIKAYTEDFLMKFLKEVFEPGEKLKKNDPDAIQKAYKEIEKEIVKKSDNESNK